jgi:hypothetical protein
LIPVASITASAALTTSGPTPSPGIKVTARPPAEDVRPVFREGVAFIVFFTVLNFARTSSPLLQGRGSKVRVLIQRALLRAIQDSGFA